MGMVQNAKNAKRLQDAADKLRYSTSVERVGLNAAEGAVIVYLFTRFKHHEAGERVGTWFEAKQARDPEFDAAAKAYGKAMQGTSESDFKVIKRPEAQSALDKFAAA